MMVLSRFYIYWRLQLLNKSLFLMLGKIRKNDRQDHREALILPIHTRRWRQTCHVLVLARPPSACSRTLQHMGIQRENQPCNQRSSLPLCHSQKKDMTVLTCTNSILYSFCISLNCTK